MLQRDEFTADAGKANADGSHRPVREFEARNPESTAAAHYEDLTTEGVHYMALSVDRNADDRCVVAIELVEACRGDVGEAIA